MHNLAICLQKQGHEVTGSDDEIYEPAKSRLKKHGLLPSRMGWDEDRIDGSLDAVIVGMHARKDNPELQEALDQDLSLYSFPEFIYEQSRDKQRVVIAGSHGKTSTTSMIMHALKADDYEHDYLVGAQLEGYEDMVKLSDAPLIIIEGDEYLSSAIDRQPKIMHYHPHVTVITGVAWDHMNVFKRLEDYERVFEEYLEQLYPDSLVIPYEEDLRLASWLKGDEVVQETWPYRAYNYVERDGQTIVLSESGKEFAMQIFGRHNMENLKAAQLVCDELGIPEDEFLEYMTTFKGASKRLQTLASGQNATMYLDFAHAPSKVKATVSAVKEKHSDKRLVAVFELHTYSSLNKNFLPHYRSTMKDADEAIVFFNEHTLEMKRMPPLTKDEVAVAFRHANISVYTDKDALEQYLAGIDYTDTSLLMMSSGIFDGLNFNRIESKVMTA